MTELTLLETVTCPHCWASFAPEDILWVAAHADLVGDLRLVGDQPLRFLPSRFDIHGNALDARGLKCTTLACPRCHLLVPHALLEVPPYFVSILGTPSCGKSVYLTALMWELRRKLPKRFGIALQDIDPQANRMLNEYEGAFFMAREPKRAVLMKELVPKTQEAGDLYDFVKDDEQVTQYPRPFLFALQKQGQAETPLPAPFQERILCLYDNAGEHFQAGKDSAATPVTQHLARSEVLFYLFDPLQDARFRQYVTQHVGTVQGDEKVIARQETVLFEAAARIRRLRGLSQREKIDRPVLILVTKADAWGSLIKLNRTDPWRAAGGNFPAYLAFLEATSASLRNLLTKLCPELIHAAEGLSHTVLYLPVSALGTSPHTDAATRKPAICPGDIKPFWVTAPFLYALFKFPMRASGAK